MPLEVRELIIKTTIVSDLDQQLKQQAEPKINQKEVVNQCVKQVLKILKSKMER